MLVSARSSFLRLSLLLSLAAVFSHTFPHLLFVNAQPALRCASFTSCATCTRQNECGWCASSNSCVGGSIFGSNYACSAYYYFFSTCPENDPCSKFSDCASCKLNSFTCAWCGPTASYLPASGMCMGRQKEASCTFRWDSVCYSPSSSAASTGTSSSSSNGAQGGSSSNGASTVVTALTPETIFAPYADGSASPAEASGIAFLTITLVLSFVGCFVMLRSKSLRPEQGRYFSGPVEGRTARALNRHFLTILLLGSLSIKAAALFLNRWTIAKLTSPYELDYGILSVEVSTDSIDALYKLSYAELCTYVRSDLCNLIAAGSGLSIGFACVSLVLITVQALIQCSYQCGQNVQVARTIFNSWRLSVITLFTSNAVWLIWLFACLVPMRHMHGTATVDLSWKLFIITTAIDVVAHLLVHRAVGLEAKPMGAAFAPAGVAPLPAGGIVAVQLVQPERFRGQAPPMYDGVPEGMANAPVHYGVPVGVAAKPAAGPGMSAAALAILDPEEYNRLNASVLIHADAPPAYEENQTTEGGIRIHVERILKEREAARSNNNRTPPPPDGADHMSSPVRMTLAPHPRSQSTLRPSSGSSATPMSRSRISISRSSMPISIEGVQAGGYAPVITMVDEPEPDANAAAFSNTGATSHWEAPPSPRAVSISMRGMAPPAYPGALEEEMPEDAIEVSANHREDDVEVDDQEERKES